MQKLRYRPASESDLPWIVSIYNDTIPGRMVTADLEPITVESRVAWMNKHSEDMRPLWIVSNEKTEPIGWVSFQDFYGRPAYSITAEISIYIDKNQQGKGYGKQILLDCLSNCPGLGIHNLVGFIFAHNEPSLKLFHSCGFTDWGLLPGIALMDGLERSLIIVGKKVIQD